MVILENLKNQCCGCYACYNVCPKQCISMNVENKGFVYPKIDETKCIECGLCKKVCPVNENLKEKNKSEIPGVYASWNKNNDIRKESSSGGIFTLLAEKVLNSKGVIYGVAMDENLNPYHKEVFEVNELSKLRGSKYLQSNVGDTFAKVKKNLESGLEVLFSGTPCQVAGLKNYLNKDYEKLITCDLVCHGVPSKVVFDKYIRYLENKYKSKALKISFRDKTNGWKSFSVKIDFENGKGYIEKLQKDIFMQLFLSDLCLRESCYKCNIKLSGDITLADFWGINEIKPSIDDDKGVSLILLNTKKGYDIYQEIEKEDYKFSFEDAAKYNTCLVKPVNKPKKVEEFWRDFDKLSFEDLTKRYIKQDSRCKMLLVKVKRRIKKIINYG